MPTRSVLLFCLGLWLSITPPSAQAQLAAVRLTEVAADHVRLEIRLPFPATVEVVYGEELGDWTGRAESTVPAELHDLRLSKLSASRQYFYQVNLDGMPGDEILRFRSGRTWVTREATVLVSADVPHGAPGERDLADRLFSEPSDLLILLGGDGGKPEELVSLHGRAMADRLVLTTGGSDDIDPLRSLAFSDLALAMSGDSPLVTGDAPAAAVSWIGQVLPTVEGACWKVAASAGSFDPDSAEGVSLKKQALAAGITVLLTRGPAPRLLREGELLWVVLSDEDTAKGSGRNYARLNFSEGTLSATVLAGSTTLQSDTYSRDCPLPLAKDDEFEFDLGGDDFGFGEESSDDGDGGTEECDY